MKQCLHASLKRASLSLLFILLSVCAFAQAPSITSQPSSDTICVTGNKVFSVVASNTTSYQWQVNTGSSWTNLSNGGVYGGATTANLAITSATSGMNNYQYRCICTGSTSPAATSNAATLVVRALPTITSVTPGSVCIGQTGQVSATASSPALVSWHSASTGGTELATGSTYTVPTASSTTTYYAQAQVSYGGGADTAQTPYNTNNGQRGAMFDVQTGSKAITVTHFDCSIYSGTTANYFIYYRAGTHVGNENNLGAWTYLGGASSVTSAGNNVPTLLPIYFSVTIPANTRYSFYITNDFGGGTSYTDGTAVGNFLAGNGDVTFYEGVGKSYPFGLTFNVRNINCTMHYTTGNGCVSAVRTGATLTVNPQPNITANPTNSSIASGSNTSFGITATSTTSYVWQVSTNSGSTWSNVSNGGIYSNATTATLTLTNATSMQNGYQYRVIANNTGGCADTSTAATLTITGSAPSISTQPTNSTICSGANTSFSVTAGGTSLTYQWQVNTGSGFSNISNGGIYSNATTNTLNLTGATSAQNGYLYRCVVTGNVSPTATSNAATLTINDVPSITTQAVDRTICTGTNTTFGIVATGAGLTYQWEVSTNSGSTWSNVSNGGIYSNATTATLSLTTATVAQNGYQYRCVVTGTCSPAATSIARTLTVNPAPAITTNPGNQTVTVNGNTSFTIAASNATSYQWQVNTGSGFTNISNGGVYSNATTTTLNITSAPLSMNGYLYRCIVTGSCSPTATSSSATLTVSGSAPSISTQPSNSTICSGANTSFSVVASGTSLTYQWQVNTGSGFSNISNGGIYSNATTNTLNLTGATSTQNGYLYRCVVSGSVSPAATSNTATLTINTAPAITTQAVDRTVCVGQNTTFSIVATGAGLNYQWQESTNGGSSFSNVNSTGGMHSGTNTATLTLSNIPAFANNYQYRCVVTGSCNPSITSTARTLTVNTPPNITTQATNSTICAGANTSFTIAATGTAITYQWQVDAGIGFTNISNGGIYSNATTNTLNITAATTAVDGYQYRCVVSGTCSPSTTSIARTLTINTAPNITTQPANTNVCDGGNTSFNVVATGVGLTYQWQVNTGSGFTNISNGGIYSNATTSTLNLTGATSTQNGYLYRCVISGTCTPNVTTSVATLTISSILSINTQPTNSTICNGANTSFSVTASGSGLTYQWQVSTNGGSSFSNLSNTGIYSNVTAATLNLTGATSMQNSYQYRCVISSTCTAPANSNSATLTINTAPSVTTQPSNSTICNGANTSFTVAATGAGLTYQWQVDAGSGFANITNGGIYSNATTNTLNITGATTTENGYQYRCVVTGTCTPSATSNAATLNINTAPGITTQPANSTICDGTNTIFTVVATGAGLTYQWQVNAGSGFSNITNGGIYSNATTAILSLTGATSAQTGYQYRCVVSGTCTPSATSNAATLTINSLLVITTQPTNSTICSGNNTSFSVVAGGSGLTYQWQVNTGSGFTNLTNTGIYTGATTSTLNLTAATTAVNSYQYRCVINSICTAPSNSNAATLTVNVAPAITTQPTSSTICEGASTSFNITATGAGISYQWEVNSGLGWTTVTNTGIYTGATTASLNLTAPSAAISSSQYRCIIGGSCVPGVTSTAVTLTVNTAPTITTQAMNSTICSGSNTSFAIAATGTTLTYQWQLSTNGGSTWSNVSNTGIYTGATTNTLNLTAASTTVNGNQYRCQVTGVCTPNVTSTAVSLTVNTAPSITIQPTNRTICLGNNTSFNIAATGTGITYQWQVNDGSGWNNVINSSVYTGSTSGTLSLTAAPVTFNGYQYRCVIGGSCVPGVTSTAVTLTINTAPAITTQPINSTICEGNNTSFSIAATGTSLSYQWQVSTNAGSTWSNVANTGIYTGATTNTLNLTAATTAVHSNQYRCQVTGVCTPNVTSTAVNLTVNTAPTISTQPTNSTICELTNTSFSIAANGTGITYQWEVNTGSGWSNVANTGIYTGATTNTLNLTAATTAVHSNQYRCIVSGTCVPGITSNAVTLTINTAPVVTTDPTNSTICSGNNTSFSIVATGTTLSYQWQVSTNGGSSFNNVTNTGIYTNATTNTLNLTAATTAQNGYQYRCVVNGVCTPNTTSNAATLTVNALPAITTQASASTICEGSNTSFSIVATGTGLTYQWQVSSSGGSTWANLTNTGIYTNTTTNTLNLTAASAAVHNYQYRCVVGGTCTPAVISNAVTITIQRKPIVTTPPANKTICEGLNHNFSVIATGTNIGYQWQVNTGGGFTNITNGGVYSNATTSNLNLTNIPSSYTGYQYRCIVGGTCAPSATSASATLTVNTNPVVTAQPANRTICSGDNTTFSVTATGTGLTYQWWLYNGSSWSAITNGGIYANATAATLNVNGATAPTTAISYQYYCHISGTCATSNSDTASLLINARPNVTSNPMSIAVCESTSNIGFTIAATGTNLTYRWQVNFGTVWSNVNNINGITGATTNQLTIPTALVTMDGSQYRCVVYGTCTPNDTSSVANLTVYPLKTPLVTITASNDDICVGTSVTFSSSVTNGGSTPGYQWFINGNAVGTNNSYTSSTLADKDIVTCVMTSSYVCPSPATDTSNEIDMKVTPYSNPTITINGADGNLGCLGRAVNFTAYTTHAGPTPTFVWQVNGNPVGNNADTFESYTIQNGDVVNCIFTSSIKCPTPRTQTSNDMVMDIIPVTRSSIVIVAGPDTNVCKSTEVTLRTAYTNGGATPQYQWVLNTKDIPGETQGSLKITGLEHFDQINCRFISSARCVFPELSNSIFFRQIKEEKPEVDVAMYSLGDNNYMFKALPQNGGANPKYQWYSNGKAIGGENDSVYMGKNIQSWQRITVELYSSLECVTSTAVMSRNITTSVTNNSVEIESLNLYPNPTTGNFVLEGNLPHSSNTIMNITILNGLGQLIYEEDITTTSEELKHKISLGDRALTGSYLLRINYNGEQRSRRFVIVR